MFANMRGVLLAVALSAVSLGGCSSSGVGRAEQTSTPALEAAEGPFADVLDQRGAVASVNPLATKAGIDALAAGGNAIDAALAVAFTLGVVDSHNSGIGGGCFILVRLANGEVIALDGREMAPAQADADLYTVDGEVQPELSKTGALAVGVPGSVAALHQLQQRAGKLSFSDVLLPAADLAAEGFVISHTMAARMAATQAALQRFPSAAQIYLDDNQMPHSAGDILVQSDLAQSYRALAKQGPDWFYRGDFAQKTAQWMKENGGVVTEQDFADYHTALREPVVTDFLGYRVYGFPPPSSGGVHVAQMLNMLAQYDLQTLSELDRYHVLAEVMKIAFADRAVWLGDADFVPVPKGLVDPDYAAQQVQQIQMDKAAEDVQHGTPPNLDSQLFDKHTTHIATADRQGNWVAITTTLNTSFGSKVVVPGTGVLLNNQMDDFSIKPGVPNAFGLVGAHANSIEPGKRPLSSMSPTIVTEDDQPMLTLGAAGGPTIISQVLQALVHHLALDQPIEQAIASPRVHHQWRPATLFVEPTVDAAIREGLVERGHQIKDLGSFGATQAIAVEQGRLVPVTEPRIVNRNRDAVKQQEGE